MSNVKFNSFRRAIAKNDIDTVTIKAMFMAPSYTPDADAHVYVSDISASRAIRDEVTKYEGDETRGIIGKIENHFSRTNKDEKKIITMKKINFI